MQEGTVCGRTLLGMEKLVGWKLVNYCSSVSPDHTFSSFPHAIVVITARKQNERHIVSGSTFLPYVILPLIFINGSEYSAFFLHLFSLLFWSSRVYNALSSPLARHNLISILNACYHITCSHQISVNLVTAW